MLEYWDLSLQLRAESEPFCAYCQFACVAKNSSLLCQWHRLKKNRSAADSRKKVFKKTNHYFSLIYWRVSFFLGETKKNTSKLRRQDWRNHLS